MCITKKESSDRIGYVDLLKFIGLTAIILAHVDAPNWLMFLRSFDVPFMVILSAILGEKSYQRYQNNNVHPLLFCINRFKRLVIPTWIFLVFYFSAFFVAKGELYDLDYYVSSFLLTRYGIGYVWIILIYFYSALFIPVCSKLELRKLSVMCVSVIYVLYELAFYFQIGVENKFIDTTFYYMIPYGVLTFLGYNFHKMKMKQRNAIIIVSFALFVCFGILYWKECGTIQLLWTAKYPPRMYYLSYGVAVSFLLLTIFEKKNLKLYDSAMIRFISMNSLWIYLWHIFVLVVYSFLDLPEIWYVKLPVVYIMAMGIVFVANRIVDKIESKYPVAFLKYLKG